MKGLSRLAAGMSAAIALAACGGGGTNSTSPSPRPTDFNLQTGVSNMVAHGLTAKVTLSGSVLVNGTSTPFTGSGTYTRSAGVSATFNGAAALSQMVSVAGTVTAAGQTQPYSTSVTEYYATTNSAFLGEDDGGNEYDVAQAPIAFPTSIVGGSTGTLGTVSRYTDKTMSVPLGTVQLSYTTMTPVDPGSPLQITLTNKIYDAQNTLTETDLMTYNLSSAGVLTFVSASAQTQSGTVTLTAQ